MSKWTGCMVHGKCNTQQVLRPPFPQRFTYSSAYLRRKRLFHPLGFHTQSLSWRAGLASRWPRAWGRWVCSWSWRTWTGTWQKKKGDKWVSDRKAIELEMNWELKWKRAEGTEGGGGGMSVCVCVCLRRGVSAIASSHNGLIHEHLVLVRTKVAYVSRTRSVPPGFPIHSCKTMAAS